MWGLVLFFAAWNVASLLIAGLLVWALVYHVGMLVQCGKDIHEAQEAYDKADKEYQDFLKEHGM